MPRIELGKTAEIEPGRSKTFVKHGKKILVANVAGKFVAYENLCPHMGGVLRSGGSDKIFTCSWHGARFAIESGEGVSEDMIGNKLKPMAVIAEGDTLYWEQGEERSPWADDFS